LKKSYSVILTPDASDGKPGYSVYVPDFDIGTQGYDYDDAIYMARDAIYQVGLSLLDEGYPVPEPSSVEYTPQSGQIPASVDVDFAVGEVSDTCARVRV
jgi:predicted RNase H-like HicB family nuclease